MRAQSAMPAVLSSTAAMTTDVQVDVPDCSRLLELFALVPDPRRRRGVRHQVASVLAVAAAAVLAGCKSVLAIGEWAAEAPPELLAALGARRSRLCGRLVAPHVATFRRLLRRVDADAVDVVIGIYLAERAGLNELARSGEDEVSGSAGEGDEPSDGQHGGSGEAEPCEPAEPEQVPGDAPIVAGLAVDGKAARGARRANGRAVHLLSAMIHGHGAVVAQRDVAHKTNEITQLKPLLDPLNLAGWAVTLDAMHCQTETARYLVEDKDAAYVFTAAKDNQPTLVARLDALAWESVPIGHTMRDRGHGRDEKRTIQVLPAPEGIWPYARQVFLIERYNHDLDGQLTSAAAALGLTCLSPGQADPEQLIGLVRNHWGIESLHWIRDATFDEDHSQLRTGSAPQVMAGLSNLAVGAIRTAGTPRSRPPYGGSHDSPSAPSASSDNPPDQARWPITTLHTALADPRT